MTRGTICASCVLVAKISGAAATRVTDDSGEFSLVMVGGIEWVWNPLHLREGVASVMARFEADDPLHFYEASRDTLDLKSAGIEQPMGMTATGLRSW